MATQCLWQRKPKSMRITVDGTLASAHHRQGHHPRHHRQDRRRRRGRPCDRICRQRDPRPVDGRPPHALQHVDRGRRPRRHGRARRHHLPLSEGQAVRAQGRRTGTRRWPSGRPCRPTTARRSTREVTLNAAEIAPMVTWGTQPRGRAVDQRPRARSRLRAQSGQAGEHEAGARIHGPQARHADGRHRRRQASSSAPAPTAASRICAPPRRSPRAARPRSRRGSWRAPAWSRSRPRPRASTRSSARPASTGASRAARCASASTATPACSASASPRPPTATSSAARASACAPIW